VTDPRIDVAFPTRHSLGESPLWDHRTGELVWVDIDRGQLWAARAGGDPHVVIEVDGALASVALASGGGYLLAVDRDIVRFDPHAATLRDRQTLAVLGTRCNDGAVDSAGRLWLGSMDPDHGPGRGSLFRVADDTTEVLTEVGISNGIGWSGDDRRMYYTDTLTRTLDVFDFDAHSGTASARRALAVVEDAAGYPDGLTVDVDGCVWVALWDGGAIRCYDPDGIVARHVPLPVSRPTSCTFGGPDLATLYVTTAFGSLTESARTAEPLAGAVLAIGGLARGLPAHEFRSHAA
jgi:sugar lactone lactonase YvrE